MLLPLGQFNSVLLADPEKASLDYCYLHPELRTADDFAALRLNTDALQARLNFTRLADY